MTWLPGAYDRKYSCQLSRNNNTPCVRRNKLFSKIIIRCLLIPTYNEIYYIHTVT